MCKGLCNKIEEWANSRLGKLVSYLFRAKITLVNSKLHAKSIIVHIIQVNNAKEMKYKQT